MKSINKRKSKWEWYGVKLLYECIISGTPNPDYIDENYTSSSKTYEENIILVKAQSFDHAYKVAEKLANEAGHSYTNIYDEIVEWKFVEAIDAFQLFDDILKTRLNESCESRSLKHFSGEGHEEGKLFIGERVVPSNYDVMWIGDFLCEKCSAIMHVDGVNLSDEEAHKISYENWGVWGLYLDIENQNELLKALLILKKKALINQKDIKTVKDNNPSIVLEVTSQKCKD